MVQALETQPCAIRRTGSEDLRTACRPPKRAGTSSSVNPICPVRRRSVGESAKRLGFPGVAAWEGDELIADDAHGGGPYHTVWYGKDVEREPVAYAMTTFRLASRTVHRVGFGAMQLPGPGVFGPPRDHDEAVRVLHPPGGGTRVDHVDTAQYYGPMVANELIREALHPYPRTSPW